MTCENCTQEHEGQYGSGRFCSSKCARGYATKNNRDAINRKVSDSLKARPSSINEDTRRKMSENNVSYWQGKKRSVKDVATMKASSRVAELKNTFHPTKGCRYCKEVGNVTYYGSICSTCKLTYRDAYKTSCKFNFNVYHYSAQFDLTLLETHGWYAASNKGNNPNGISRDHMYSVSDGYANKIDPSILSHPANCRLVLHKDNQRKHSKSIITLEELLERIKFFDQL